MASQPLGYMPMMNNQYGEVVRGNLQHKGLFIGGSYHSRQSPLNMRRTTRRRRRRSGKSRR